MGTSPIPPFWAWLADSHSPPHRTIASVCDPPSAVMADLWSELTTKKIADVIKRFASLPNLPKHGSAASSTPFALPTGVAVTPARTVRERKQAAASSQKPTTGIAATLLLDRVLRRLTIKVQTEQQLSSLSALPQPYRYMAALRVLVLCLALDPEHVLVTPLLRILMDPTTCNDARQSLQSTSTQWEDHCVTVDLFNCFITVLECREPDTQRRDGIAQMVTKVMQFYPSPVPQGIVDLHTRLFHDAVQNKVSIMQSVCLNESQFEQVRLALSVFFKYLHDPQQQHQQLLALLLKLLQQESISYFHHCINHVLHPACVLLMIELAFIRYIKGDPSVMEALVEICFGEQSSEKQSDVKPSGGEDALSMLRRICLGD